MNMDDRSLSSETRIIRRDLSVLRPKRYVVDSSLTVQNLPGYYAFPLSEEETMAFFIGNSVNKCHVYSVLGCIGGKKGRVTAK